MSADDTTGFAQIMTPAEALMWRVSSDPWLDPSGSLITILDKPVDTDVLRARLKAGVAEVPRLAERVVESSNPLIAPRWEIDPDFDLNHHFVEISLPDPGDDQALLDFATDAHLSTFHPERPPWRMYLVDGLSGGRSALVARLHHSVADGIGALRMAALYLDIDASAPVAEPVDLAAALADHQAATPPADSGVADFVAEALRVPLAMTRSALAELALVGSDPARLRISGEHAVAVVSALLTQLTGDAAIDSASTQWRGRSADRELVAVDLSLPAAKNAASRRGGTVNDVFVATMAQAVLAVHDDPLPHVALSYVRSTRRGDEAGGNAFVPNRVTAPGTAVDDDTRFGELHDAMRPGDNAAPTVGLDQLADVAALLPGAALSKVGRDQGQRVDVVTSNLHGSPIPLFVAGAGVQRMIPIGPIAGAACNATLMSYGDTLTVGVIVDPAAIDDSSHFADAIRDAFASLTT